MAATSLLVAASTLDDVRAEAEAPGGSAAESSGGQGTRELKIATVDMKRVFAGYHKTTEAERLVNEGKAEAKRALDDRNAKYKSLISKWQEKQKAINDPQINEVLRVSLQKSASAIAAEAKALERTMAEFRGQRERQLKAHVMRMRKAILNEIQAEMINAARRRNVDLLLDSSGLSLGGTPFLLYAKDVDDLSEGLLIQLNEDHSE